ncbi:hypothetical protein [Thiomicrorhabdus sp.]|uniref:hypothetical protein n=1 Tax=Thiomicrorhabdus sp. TaxID=2039724 RepID=UPI0029C6B38D|nr:hypothetical protein [Thiomicrorhabdus sp.]
MSGEQLAEWQTIDSEQIQQSEQQNGFYLIELKISRSTPFDWQSSFRLLEAPDQPLSLFRQQIRQNSLLLQFLSDRKSSDRGSTTLQFKDAEKHYHIQSDAPLMLLGSGLHMATLFDLADRRKPSDAATLALLHSQTSFAFPVKPARFIFPGSPSAAIGACPLLEDWQIPNRLASDLGLPGCYDGALPDLLQSWLQHASAQDWQFILATPNDIQRACIAVLQDHNCEKIIY